MEVSLSGEELWKFYLVSKSGNFTYLVYERLRKRLFGKKDTSPILNYPFECLFTEGQLIFLLFRGYSGRKRSFVAFSPDSCLYITLDSHVRYCYTIPFQPFCQFSCRLLLIVEWLGYDYFGDFWEWFLPSTKCVVKSYSLHVVFPHLRIVRMFAPISTKLCVIQPLSILFVIFLVWIGCSWDHNYLWYHSKNFISWQCR